MEKTTHSKLKGVMAQSVQGQGWWS